MHRNLKIDTEKVRQRLDNVHLKWMIDPSDDTKIVCNDYLTDDDRPVSYMTEMEKEAVNTPVIRLEIMDLNQDVNSIKISGSYTGDYNKSLSIYLKGKNKDNKRQTTIKRYKYVPGDFINNRASDFYGKRGM